jgi:hypothetical protein
VYGMSTATLVTSFVSLLLRNEEGQATSLWWICG